MVHDRTLVRSLERHALHAVHQGTIAFAVCFLPYPRNVVCAPGISVFVYTIYNGVLIFSHFFLFFYICFYFSPHDLAFPFWLFFSPPWDYFFLFCLFFSPP